MYGAGGDTDAYFLAAAGANFVVSLVQVSFEGAALPRFAADRARGGSDARALLVGTASRAVVVAAAFGLVTALVLAFGLLPRTRFAGEDDARLLVALLATVPLAVAVNSSLAACHYAYGSFVRPTVSQAFRSLLPLALCVVGGGELGLPVVAAGLVVGELLRTVLLAATLPRAVRRTGMDAEPPAALTGLWRTSAALLTAQVIVGLNPLIDKAVAGAVAVGGVTLIELAEKLFYVPTVLFAAMAGLVLAADWGRLAGQDPGRAALKTDFWLVQRRVAYASTAFTATVLVVTLAVGERLADVLSISDRRTFVVVLACYLVGIPFAFVIELSSRLVVVLDAARVLPYVSCFALTINIVADLVGAHLIGVAGIAVASTVVRIAAALVFLLIARRQLVQPDPVAVEGP